LSLRRGGVLDNVIAWYESFFASVEVLGLPPVTVFTAEQTNEVGYY